LHLQYLEPSPRQISEKIRSASEQSPCHVQPWSRCHHHVALTAQRWQWSHNAPSLQPRGLLKNLQGLLQHSGWPHDPSETTHPSAATFGVRCAVLEPGLTCSALLAAASAAVTDVVLCVSLPGRRPLIASLARSAAVNSRVAFS